MVCAYIDGVLFINKNDFLEDLMALEKVLHKLVEAVLKVNAEK